MNEVYGVFARDSLMLLAHGSDLKCMAVLWAAQDDTGHKLYHFDTAALARKAMPEPTMVALFDGRLTSRVKRHLMFVRRGEKAPFPGWIPKEFPAGVLINRDNAQLCYRVVAARFEKWMQAPPRNRAKQTRSSPERYSWEIPPSPYFS